MMSAFLIPFFAFMAVMLIMLLLYGVWLFFFDSHKKLKNQRLQSIQNTFNSTGQSISSAQDSKLEIWLRSRSKRFARLENRIIVAHVSLTIWGFMGIMLALFTVVMVLGLLRQTNPLLLLVLAVAIASTPLKWLSKQANKRRQAFGDKLPETLDYISRAMRAGHSLTSAIGMVGKELADPIGIEFKMVFDEIAFGIPFKETLIHLGQRVQSFDLNFFIISLMIHHEAGGNLTELLDGLSGTMRERIKLRGKIRTLSSEGRSSAWVLGCMPFFMVGMLTLVNPPYMSLLWTTHQGQTLLLISSGLMAAGFYSLNSITQIKV